MPTSTSTRIASGFLVVGGVAVAVGGLAFSWLIPVAAGCLAIGAGVGTLFGMSVRQQATAAPAAGPATRFRQRDLDDLEMRAKVKGAFVIASLVDRLGKLRPKLDRVPIDDPQELGHKLRELFDTTASSLQDAFDLTLAARELATDSARETIYQERDTLVLDAGPAADALEAGVDRVLTAAAMAKSVDRSRSLGELSTTLDRQLEVARRVDDRMRQLEARARGDLSHHEQYIAS